MKEAFLTDMELGRAKAFLEASLAAGADACRVTLSKSVMDLVGVLDGSIDKITHSMDRSITLAIFADGRYGSFSTNRIEEDCTPFVKKAIETVRMMAPDLCRKLPPLDRTFSGTGDLGICNADAYENMTMEGRIALALAGSVFTKSDDILSEEAEYSDSLTDTCIIDSNGTWCRQSECSFEFANEITIKDGDAKVSAYWWDSARTPECLDTQAVGLKALNCAMDKRNAGECEGGKMTMITDSECSSRLLAPVLTALNAFSIQQNNSFLAGKLGEKLFPDFMDLIDEPFERGAFGSRLFDTEGVAVKESPIIEKGVVKAWFINTYMAEKMGMEPTVDDASRPCLKTTVDKDCNQLVEEYKKDKLVLVTGFNGGNCNNATGDFSFGVEGFYYGPEGTFPVREMVITGNMIELWNKLEAIGNDPRPCRARVIPSLVFKDIDFSS